MFYNFASSATASCGTRPLLFRMLSNNHSVVLWEMLCYVIVREGYVSTPPGINISVRWRLGYCSLKFPFFIAETTIMTQHLTFNYKTRPGPVIVL